MDAALEPTPAIVKGLSYVVQCPNCGVLVAVPANGKARTELGSCPSCSRNQRWELVQLPIGPFKPVENAQ
jgi:hypothetical protein